MKSFANFFQTSSPFTLQQCQALNSLHCKGFWSYKNEGKVNYYLEHKLVVNVARIRNSDSVLVTVYVKALYKNTEYIHPVEKLG